MTGTDGSEVLVGVHHLGVTFRVNKSVTLEAVKGISFTVPSGRGLRRHDKSGATLRA